VRNRADKPLAGVVIALKGAKTSTTTNSEGDFYLAYDTEVPVVVLNYAGYQTQTLRLLAKSPVAITLYETGTPLLPQKEGVEMVMEVEETPDVEASFTGGAAAYTAYMKQNMHYPEAAEAKGLSGTVFVSFVIDEQGRILNPQVSRGCEGFNAEALRLVSNMPWWTPARRHDKPIRSTSYLRVRFEYHTE
jgi:TonB family protein